MADTPKATSAYIVDHTKPSVNCDSIAELFSQQIGSLTSNAFDAIDDTLFDFANNAHSNNEQNRYFEAMRELRLKRKIIIEQLCSHTKYHFKSSEVAQAKKGTPQNGNDLENLSLIENNDLEERLALQTMSSKATKSLESISLTLTARLTKAYDLEGKHFNNPMSAELLADTVAKCCQNLDIELSERLLLYKHIDKHVFNGLDSCYETINSQLLTQGILPSLNNKTAKPLRQPATERDQAKGAHTPLAKTGASSPTQEAAHSTANTRELIQALSAITASLAQGKPHSTENIAQALQHSLSTKANKQLNEKDLDIINLVGMLFEYILGDDNLAPEMQALIGRLQIPALKVVLQSPSFFKSHNHPARLFLDKLASAAIGWTKDTNNLTKESLYLELKIIVSQVVEEQSNYAHAFEQAGKRLESLLGTIDRRRSLLEHRTKLSEEGRIKSRVATQFVKSTLSSLTPEENALPPSVNALLNGPWQQVMFLAFLKDENEHNWEPIRRTTETLVWCAQYHSSDTSRQKWIAVVPRLLKDIANELRNIALDANQINHCIAQLRKELATRFRDGSLSNQATENTKHKGSKAKHDSPQNSAIQQQASTNIDTHNGSQRLLDEGGWIELQHKNQSKQRRKLISHISEAGVYVFVDRAGLHPIELSQRQLEQDIERGIIKVLDKGALVDRALNHIMTNLQR